MKAVRSLRAGAEAVWEAYSAEMMAGGIEAETVATVWIRWSSFSNFILDFWPDFIHFWPYAARN